MVVVPSIVIEKPAAPVGIALDVSKTKWNKYFTNQAFWFFRSEASVRTEEEAFQSNWRRRMAAGRDSPGKPGIPVQWVQPDTKWRRIK
ncbi:hypothetical protein MPLDJ20_230062 [Mesorhizobium plurifarium]|uniref:Uncharacterized protein n=1 Tax=Mesorhizobium plurifarium TaxID=69974 RepID=A0A090F3U0_MESPL|nr:hypothetical protein MPLDJ20_230062 [Mesorhizobium plurifarium]CDX53486.1 hypothetical protein MPL3365_180152 [Mesorhizobium plurifarium]